MTDLRVCFIECAHKREAFFFSVNSLHEARLVLDAISRFDLHFRPEPSELATAGWVERRAGDGWEDLTENELDELIAEQSE